MPDERRRTSGTAEEGKGSMTVEEAGHKGGQRVKELVQEGKKSEGETRK